MKTLIRASQRLFVYAVVPCCLAAMSFSLLAPAANAQEHVVPLNELHSKTQALAQERTTNIQDIERVLAYPAAADALSKANVNSQQVHQAISTLDDHELARLAERARASEKDVQGGLIIGILALIGLIVVIIVVVTVLT